MSIVTKTGDDGLTSLWSGERLRKDEPRVEAYGTIDELSSFLGLAIHACGLADTKAAIQEIQLDLVRAGGELASIGQCGFARAIGPEDLGRIERRIETLESRIALKGFVLPGRNEASARLDIARVVCRRAERRVLSLSRDADIGQPLRRYLNRLSDLLFMLARAEEEAAGGIVYAERSGA